MPERRLVVLTDEVARNLIGGLEGIEANDRSRPYEYGEARMSDGKCPPVGGCWNTPREMASKHLRTLRAVLEHPEGISEEMIERAVERADWENWDMVVPADRRPLVEHILRAALHREDGEQ